MMSYTKNVFHRPYASFPNNVLYSKEKKVLWSYTHTQTRFPSPGSQVASSHHVALSVLLARFLGLSLLFMTLTLLTITD